MFPRLSNYEGIIIIALIYLSTVVLLQHKSQEAIEIEREKIMIRTEIDAEIADSQAERALEMKQEALSKQEKKDAENVDMMSKLHLEETLNEEMEIVLREMKDIDSKISSGRIEVMINPVVGGGIEVYGSKEAGTILFFDKETDKVTEFSGTKAQSIHQSHVSVIGNTTEFDRSFPVEHECSPSDAIMVSKKGVTMFDDHTSPIRITFQNTTYVEFEVVNTFEHTFTSVHVEYYTGTFGETECLEEQNIKPLSIISDYKAKCTGTDPYSIVRIWISDDVNGDLLSPNDNANIPKCCHPRDEEVLTVMYTFKLSCVNPCE